MLMYRYGFCVVVDSKGMAKQGAEVFKVSSLKEARELAKTLGVEMMVD
jgi:hypothetical protein